MNLAFGVPSSTTKGGGGGDRGGRREKEERGDNRVTDSLLQPKLSLLGASIVMERERQHNVASVCPTAQTKLSFCCTPPLTLIGAFIAMERGCQRYSVQQMSNASNAS